MERLEQHGEIARRGPDRHARPRTGRPIRRRVADNGRVLLGAYRALAEAIKDERSITPAAEWLVDNFHIVEEQLREIRDDLPPALLPRAAQARRRSARGLSAGPRPGLGLRRPHRQPVRPGQPPSAGGGVPAGAAADARRAVGGRDQPAHPAGREPAPRWPSRSCASREARAAGGRAGRRAARPRQRRIRDRRGRAAPALAADAADGRSWSSSSSGCATRTRP